MATPVSRFYPLTQSDTIIYRLPVLIATGSISLGRIARMIDRNFAVVMAAYNAEMNRRIFAAAWQLTDAERRQDRGAFWGSIHGTLSHLLWGDQVWMSRFAGWPKPSVSMKNSGSLHDRFETLETARTDSDRGIELWAGTISQEWLVSESTWYSSAAGREMCKPNSLLVVHFFNHQTHHRGQVHAMLTAAGKKTGDTDLLLVV
jgi:uncharacterized damage-inducible protein DinB